MTRTRAICIAVAALLVGAALLDAAPPVRSSSTVTPDEHGPVTDMALDAQGNGFFATGTAHSALTIQRLVNGKPPWLTYGDPATLNMGMLRMILTSRGDDGWAIGAGGAKKVPLVWRFQGGAWGTIPHDFASSIELTDLALSLDGSDGWIVGRDRDTGAGVLMRLRMGAWLPAALPPESVIAQLAINSDGARGWAIGSNRHSPSISILFRLRAGKWSAISSNPFPAGQVAKLVACDNAGNGWAIAEPAGKRTGPDSLFRLTADGKARVVSLAAPPTGFSPEPHLVLSALDVNAKGDGWAAGSLYLGKLTRYEYAPAEEQYQVVPVRLRGDSAAPVPPEAVGMFFNSPYNSEPPNIRPTRLTIGPDGVLTVLAGTGGHGNGQLYLLHEPWPYRLPPSAYSVPGVGRCFASKPYCLRGAFARYWEMHGGAQRFGYPITPEVREELRERTGGDWTTRNITVQYTERARLECVEACAAPEDVTLGHLGREWVEIMRLRASASSPTPDLTPFNPLPARRITGKPWVPETGHFVGPPFVSYWRNNGGVPLFGFPISEQFQERDADGKTRLVQYFERTRLVHYPDRKGTPREIEPDPLGLLVFESKYGYRP